MNEKLKKFTEKLKTDKKMSLILICAVTGVVLLLLSSGGSKTVKKENTYDAETVRLRMIKDTEELLKSVKGVGKVKVYITVDSMEKHDYAQNKEEENKEDSVKTKENYVVIKSGGNESGLELCSYTPAVRGVAVSCEGGGSAVVRQEVTKLVSAAFGISKNKVWVSEMKKDR